MCDNLAPDGRQYNYNNDNDPEDYLDGGEYVLGYKKINGLWMELRAWKFPRENVFVHPSFSAVGPMPSKAVYKCIKTTNTYGAPDDGTANGFGDKGHQYAQVCSATVKGTRIHINDDKSNWRANYNVQKVYGGQQRESVALTNSDALKGADVFVGVSKPNLVTDEMVHSMNNDPIIFAMANPEPEITYQKAKAAGARVVGTGRSDYPNQINNVLAFPGIFKGALEARVPSITPEMKVAVAKAIADTISDEDLNEENIMPKIFNKDVTAAVANAIKQFAK